MSTVAQQLEALTAQIGDLTKAVQTQAAQIAELTKAVRTETLKRALLEETYQWGFEAGRNALPSRAARSAPRPRPDHLLGLPALPGNGGFLASRPD